jgi:hypothetical protein
MRRKWAIKGLRFAAFGLIVVAALGWVVTGLWNILIPTIFGLPAIGFWQAMGLLLLSRVLFGGLRGWGGHGMRRRQWERMTPDERERLRQGFGRRCGRSEQREPVPGM